MASNSKRGLFSKPFRPPSTSIVGDDPRRPSASSTPAGASPAIASGSFSHRPPSASSSGTQPILFSRSLAGKKRIVKPLPRSSSNRPLASKPVLNNDARASGASVKSTAPRTAPAQSAGRHFHFAFANSIKGNALRETVPFTAKRRRKLVRPPGLDAGVVEFAAAMDEEPSERLMRDEDGADRSDDDFGNWDFVGSADSASVPPGKQQDGPSGHTENADRVYGRYASSVRFLSLILVSFLTGYNSGRPYEHLLHAHKQIHLGIYSSCWPRGSNRHASLPELQCPLRAVHSYASFALSNSVQHLGVCTAGRACTCSLPYPLQIVRRLLRVCSLLRPTTSAAPNSSS